MKKGISPFFSAAPLCLLLAQASSEDKKKMLTTVAPSDISKEINKGIQHDMPWDLLLIGIGTTILCIAAISIRRWWLRRMNDPSPLVLYSAIARKAGLSLPDRFVLWRVSRFADLPTPIALLLSRGTLRYHTERYAQHLGRSSREKHTQRFARIEAELFG